MDVSTYPLIFLVNEVCDLPPEILKKNPQIKSFDQASMCVSIIVVTWY